MKDSTALHSSSRVIWTGTESRRVTVVGDVDVAVYRDGKVVTAIDKKGKLSLPEEENKTPAKEITGVFAMRNGHQTVISLPADTEYELVITAPKDCNILFYDLLLSVKKLSPETGRLFLGDIDAGQYNIEVKAGNSSVLSVKKDGGENKLRFINSRFNYSPVIVMGDELAATVDSHLTLSLALFIAMAIMAGTFLLLIICLIIHGIHRYKVKKGHAPYSDWYVIVPHFIVIAISAFSVPNMIAFFVMVTLLSVLAAMTFRRGSMFRRIKQKNSVA